MLTVLGPRDSGKTSLLRKLTNAQYGGVPVTNSQQQRIGETFDLHIKGKCKFKINMIEVIENRP